MLGQWVGLSHRGGSDLCYFILSEKGNFYLEPQFSTLLMKNQDILMFKSGSVIIVDVWKMYLVASSLVIVWIDMTPLLIMMRRVLLRVTLTRRDIKDLHISLR